MKWFGHKTRGLSRFDNTFWSELRYKNVDMLGEKIAVDSSNNKWFSAEPGVLLSYNDREFINYSIISYDDDLNPWCSLSIYSIVVDNNNCVYILARGVCDFKHFRYIYHHDGKIMLYRNLQHINSYSLAVDSSNYLFRNNPPSGYIVGYNNFYFADGKVIEGPEDFIMTNIYFDHNDMLWSFSISGLALLVGETWKIYTTDNSGLLTYNIFCITADRTNTIWIGTDAGVSRFDGETWTTFNTENSGLCDNKVNAIAVEINNTIWFGTDNGVSRYTGEVITTGVDEEDETPEALPVLHSFPNPFNPSTTIEFTLPESGFTTLSLYNISGQKVSELAAGHMTTGTHSLTWDGRDDSGNTVSSGVYITRLVAGKQVTAGKMILIK